MPTIASSVISQNRIQADGRRKIVELHTDTDGIEHRRRYLAEPGDDVDVNLSRTATRLDTKLAEQVTQVRDDANYESALAKIRTYLDGSDLKTDAGLTVEEDAILAERGI